MGESLAVFNVQTSRWNREKFYVNVGLYFSALGDDKTPYEYNCHIRNRIRIEQPELVVDNAIKWFASASNMKEAKTLVESNPTEYSAGRIFMDAKIT